MSVFGETKASPVQIKPELANKQTNFSLLASGCCHVFADAKPNKDWSDQVILVRPTRLPSQNINWYIQSASWSQWSTIIVTEIGKHRAKRNLGQVEKISLWIILEAIWARTFPLLFAMALCEAVSLTSKLPLRTCWLVVEEVIVECCWKELDDSNCCCCCCCCWISTLCWGKISFSCSQFSLGG